MSSILKALKKLEYDNASRKRDPLRIDAEILRGSPPVGISPLKRMLVALTLFACGGGATYLYLKHTPWSPQAPLTHGSGLAQVSHTRYSSVNHRTAPVPIELITPEPIVAATPESNIERNHEKAPSLLLKQSPQHKPHPLQQKQPDSTTSHNSASKHKTGTGAQSTLIPRLPTLKVNGIAFQDGTDSVAVVNDIPVAKGSLIEGVRVDEILRDRVQFSSGGEKLEIFLGKSNR
ncbi:MAG: hypothetical protein HXX11_02905 [Desulfuromonadales bacterium]|nr:hypothetical protein [Desulfuromonadales bacterium]